MGSWGLILRAVLVAQLCGQVFPRTVICKPEALVPDGPSLPTLIFVAGVEGSGHHGFVPVLLELPGMYYVPMAEQLLTDAWDPSVSIDQRLERMKKFRATLSNSYRVCKQKPGNPCSHFMINGRWNFFSYPYDSPRNPLRHPDLLELINILESTELAVQFDVKVLVLHRSLESTVLSGFRRGFLPDKRCLSEYNRGKRTVDHDVCNGVWMLARDAEMSLTYLNAELSALSPEYFRVIKFNQLVREPVKFAGPVARFLGLPSSMADYLTNRLHTQFSKGHRKHVERLPSTHLEEVHSFFDERRYLRWDLMMSGLYDVINYEHNQESREHLECFVPVPGV